MLLGQCSTIASLPKTPQLHFLFTDRVPVIPPTHKCCVRHYKKKVQPLLNPQTKLHKSSYLKTEFLPPLALLPMFVFKGRCIPQLWSGWEKTKTASKQSRFNSLPPLCVPCKTKASKQPSISFSNYCFLQQLKRKGW